MKNVIAPIAESVSKVDATTERHAPTFWEGRSDSSGPLLGWDVEVQHRSFSLNWFEPALSDVSKDFNLHCWKLRLRLAGPRPATMPDEIVLEVVEEHGERDFNPLHSRL